MKGGHGPTKLLHAFTWGAFDHASHAVPPTFHLPFTYCSVNNLCILSAFSVLRNSIVYNIH